MNRATIVGHIGRDAELRFTSNGTAVVNFSVATTETWSDRGGEKKKHTEWHNVTVWGARAEELAPVLLKGAKVFVEGRLRTRDWEKDGQKHKTTEITADYVWPLVNVTRPTTAVAEPEIAPVEDSIPF